VEAVIEAILTAVVYLLGAAFYLCVMVPLGLLCYFAAIVCLPLDLLVLICSLGTAQFEVFKAFRKG